MTAPTPATTVHRVVGVGEAMALFEPVPPARLEDGGSVTSRVAGAEMNALVAVARLGSSAAFVSAVGDDPFGRLVTRTLVEQEVDVTCVAVDADRPTGVFFKDVTGADARQVHYYRSGSAAAGLDDHRAVEAVERLAPDLFVVSGLTLGLGVDGGLGDAARAAIGAARAVGATVVFDANLRRGIWDGDHAARQFAGLVDDLDVVLAGAEELSVLVPGQDPRAAARALCDAGVLGVLVKHGARGATCVEAGTTTAIPPVRVDAVVDPVGAGDAFAGGVCHGLASGWDLPAAARLGAALGSSAVTVTGDWEGLPTRAEAATLVTRHAPPTVSERIRRAP